jgi:hypothetical protein
MLTFSGSQENDPRIMEWRADHQGVLGKIAADWFRVIRTIGPDVTELLHDGLLTVCVDDFPFAYVGAHKAHVSVGFFYGVDLIDPTNLLQGAGKRMRHVKLRGGDNLDTDALTALIEASYLDITRRIK